MTGARGRIGTAQRVPRSIVVRHFFPCLLPWLLAAGVLPGCREPFDPELLTKLQTAQQTFDQAQQPEEFRRAAAIYQEVLDTGIKSSAVWYNQGNAFFRAGDRGRAVACYRQALRYRPRDARLLASLRQARGRSASGDRKQMADYVFFWQHWLSYPETVQLSGLFAVMAFCLAVASLFVSSAWIKRAAWGMLLLTLLLVGLATFDWYRFTQIRHGVLVTDEVVLRKGNAESYEPAITGTLSEGTELRVLEHRGDWVLVRLDGGQQGWIPISQAVIY